MAATSRKEVFIEKVLKRLYCSPSSPSHLQGPPVQLETSSTSEAEQKDLVNIQTSTKCTPSTVGEKEIPSRKLYTVSLPPDGCLPCCPVTSNLTHSEHTESSNNSDEESSMCSTRKRARKKRKQKTWQDSGGQMASKQQTHLLQAETESPKMNKNKKRKMKKKRQKQKMKAAGLLIKATGVNFIYQPEECANEEADIEVMDRKMGEILDFLKATQEIYFTDGKSKCEDLDICSETVCEVLKQLETHRSPFSDVTLLHKLKSLVLLQDTERLKAALEHFREHSVMLPEHARVVCSLFNYWITDILPLKNRKHEYGELSVFT